MANSDSKIKEGMGGSRCGRNRYEKTEVLKNQSKKRRRQQGELEATEQLYTSSTEDFSEPCDNTHIN